MTSRRLNNWLGLGIIFIFLYWFYHPSGIFVLGDPYSVFRLRAVMSQLRFHLPESYRLVVDHIDAITISYAIIGKNAAGLAQEDPKRGDTKVTLLENTFVQGEGYTAATLVHEACHGAQFDKGLPFEPFCELQAREHECNEMGIEVLIALGAPEKIIQHYVSISVGDGVYGDSCSRKTEKVRVKRR